MGAYFFFTSFFGLFQLKNCIKNYTTFKSKIIKNQCRIKNF